RYVNSSNNHKGLPDPWFSSCSFITVLGLRHFEGWLRHLFVSPLDSVEQSPQNVELELQDFQRPLLHLPRGEIVQGYVQPMLNIKAGLRQPRTKVLEPLWLDPLVVLGPGGEAIVMRLRCEQ